MKKNAYPLVSPIIIKEIPRNKKGIYYLGERIDKKFRVLYVGRSETCLRARLMQHAKKGDYPFFSFKLLNSSRSTHTNESIEYHSFSNLNNKVHPSIGCDDESCLICKASKESTFLFNKIRLEVQNERD